MPPRPLPFREVKRKLESIAFEEMSQRGSHVKFARQTLRGLETVIVPKHREVAPGTLRSILRQVGMTWDEFERI